LYAKKLLDQKSSDSQVKSITDAEWLAQDALGVV
jgi:hypothetical protein